MMMKMVIMTVVVIMMMVMIMPRVGEGDNDDDDDDGDANYVDDDGGGGYFIAVQLFSFLVFSIHPKYTMYISGLEVKHLHSFICKTESFCHSLNKF